MFELKKQRSKEVEAVFPLINIIFLLIVFFLVAGRISANQWHITPPLANQHTAPIGKECTLYLKEHTLNYNNREINLNKKNSLLFLNKQCSQGIIVASPANLPAKRMIEFLNMAKEQQVKEAKILVMSHY